MPIFYVLYFPKLVSVPCFLKIFASVPLFPENKWACSKNTLKGLVKDPTTETKSPVPRLYVLYCIILICNYAFLAFNKSICLSVNMSKLWDEWQTMQSLIGLAAFDLVLDCLLRSFYPHYENTPVQICRKFHLQKLKNFR